MKKQSRPSVLLCFHMCNIYVKKEERIRKYCTIIYVYNEESALRSVVLSERGNSSKIQTCTLWDLQNFQPAGVAELYLFWVSARILHGQPHVSRGEDGRKSSWRFNTLQMNGRTDRRVLKSRRVNRRRNIVSRVSPVYLAGRLRTQTGFNISTRYLKRSQATDDLWLHWKFGFVLNDIRIGCASRVVVSAARISTRPVVGNVSNSFEMFREFHRLDKRRRQREWGMLQDAGISQRIEYYCSISIFPRS